MPISPQFKDEEHKKKLNFLYTPHALGHQNVTMLQLESEVFILLSEKLENLDQRHTSKLSHMNEQLSILMYVVGHGASNRQTQDRFQHSSETISHVFHQIIVGIALLRAWGCFLKY
ncbi:uncharacterized protein VP01_3117g7 [Puccinia sorghi]|uniref:DUF8040 domain-containing protein n=1 Tax=Puccinia sorghi TaxID=27349 RepID=A0A0L6V160_9BASI|nr:uncharacterized protein VP01_3117g7 [Puccinia sorghi]